VCLKALWLFTCILGELSVLCLPLIFPSIQVNLLNSHLGITNIWYINLSIWSSSYQIFSKAISHPFRSQFSFYTSISFITAIFRSFFVPPAWIFFLFFYQISLFSQERCFGFFFFFTFHLVFGFCLYFSYILIQIQ